MGLPFNIAIDGYSSCGKSTIAKSIAYRYNMRYIDTGAMYRAITLYFMRENIIVDKKMDSDLVTSLLRRINVDFCFNPLTDHSETVLNNENVENEIRGLEVSKNVSLVAQLREVRDKLISLQKRIGKSKNVVMDGRDIGTKVFPDAKIKLFVTAKAEIRAQRRYNQFKNDGCKITFDEILNNINARDRHDITRSINPLIMADDAILLDNSYMTIAEQDSFIDNLIDNI